MLRYSLLAAALSAALCAADATNMITTLNAPSSASNSTKFGVSQNSSNDWKPIDGEIDLAPLSETGYRIRHHNETAVFYKNRITPTSDEDGYAPYAWLPFNSGPGEGTDAILFGLYSNNLYISTDYSKPATSTVSKSWLNLTLPATVDITNYGSCTFLPPGTIFSATVNFLPEAKLPSQVHRTTAANSDELKFDIADVRLLKTIVWSFNVTMTPILANPFQVWYQNATKAPFVSSHMEIYGGFCSGDDD